MAFSSRRTGDTLESPLDRLGRGVGEEDLLDNDRPVDCASDGMGRDKDGREAAEACSRVGKAVEHREALGGDRFVPTWPSRPVFS